MNTALYRCMGKPLGNQAGPIIKVATNEWVLLGHRLFLLGTTAVTMI
jgi:hypothetical protein